MADRPLPSVPSAVADELLAEVYAQCAHEIRGALGLLVAAIDEIADEEGAPEGAATYLERGVARLERLAVRYTRVAEALDGGLGDAARSFRVGAVVERARAHVARTTGAVEVLAESEAEADVEAHGDDAAVAEALGELVLAGCRLSGAGRVRLRWGEDGEWAAVAVEPDEPVGDWPALPRPPTTEGLTSRPGLWLARALVELQGGAVEVAGPVLRVRLPRG